MQMRLGIIEAKKLVAVKELAELLVCWDLTSGEVDELLKNLGLHPDIVYLVIEEVAKLINAKEEDNGGRHVDEDFIRERELRHDP